MKNIAQDLMEDKTVTFRPRGNSMTPKIQSGQQVTVLPIVDRGSLKVGDVVLCKVMGSYYLHYILAIRGDDQLEFKIGNAHGRVNGWTRNVYGVLQS